MFDMEVNIVTKYKKYRSFKENNHCITYLHHFYSKLEFKDNGIVDKLYAFPFLTRYRRDIGNTITVNVQALSKHINDQIYSVISDNVIIIKI